MNSENNISKKAWTIPIFYILGFKETLNGNNPDTVEDTQIDAFDELSP